MELAGAPAAPAVGTAPVTPAPPGNRPHACWFTFGPTAEPLAARNPAQPPPEPPKREKMPVDVPVANAAAAVPTPMFPPNSVSETRVVVTPVPPPPSNAPAGSPAAFKTAAVPVPPPPPDTVVAPEIAPPAPPPPPEADRSVGPVPKVDTVPLPPGLPAADKFPMPPEPPDPSETTTVEANSDAKKYLTAHAPPPPPAPPLQAVANATAPPPPPPPPGPQSLTKTCFATNAVGLVHVLLPAAVNVCTSTGPVLPITTGMPLLLYRSQPRPSKNVIDSPAANAGA